MNIQLVLNKYAKSPEKVWTNIDLESLRRAECLCLNCDRKNEKSPYGSCPTAAKIFKICKEDNMAMAISRCGAMDEHGLMYRPIKKY